MPAASFAKEWGQTRGLTLYERVLKLIEASDLDHEAVAVGRANLRITLQSGHLFRPDPASRFGVSGHPPGESVAALM